MEELIPFTSYTQRRFTERVAYVLPIRHLMREIPLIWLVPENTLLTAKEVADPEKAWWLSRVVIIRAGRKPSLFFPRMPLSSYSMADRLIIMYHCSSEQLSLYACGNKLASYIKFRVAFIHVLDKVFHNWQHVNTTVNDKYCAISKEQFLHSTEYVSSIRSVIADYGLDIFYKSFNSAVSCIFHLENNSIYNTYTQIPIVASCNTAKVCSE